MVCVSAAVVVLLASSAVAVAAPHENLTCFRSEEQKKSSSNLPCLMCCTVVHSTAPSVRWVMATARVLVSVSERITDSMQAYQISTDFALSFRVPCVLFDGR